ncbi:uracil-DNA glycosylase [Candidatus Saccharibacteria bacterium]|nr:uracil-DNA glycosylase [Candidatus Saccharibacteria bacterium]MBR3323461.1 uracil-DNA glycosylase [Candidatus Saccharibacteria bacterium]
MHESWKPFLNSEFAKPYFKELSDFLHHAYQTATIFPPKNQVFRAFTTDLNKVTVVILGQDPYHTPGAAHGLAFSVPDSQPIPPSLINIYKEIDADCGSHHNQTGNLSSWQDQGVLLLNNVLTVEAHRAGSHRGKGWEIFTEATIKYLNETRPHLVFILWGRDARSKAPLIDESKHLILESPHPSPLSAHAGFFGNHHFSQANEFLRSFNLPEINW